MECGRFPCWISRVGALTGKELRAMNKKILHAAFDYATVVVLFFTLEASTEQFRSGR
jgi:hypothetical protein